MQKNRHNNDKECEAWISYRLKIVSNRYMEICRFVSLFLFLNFKWSPVHIGVIMCQSRCDARDAYVCHRCAVQCSAAHLLQLCRSQTSVGAGEVVHQPVASELCISAIVPQCSEWHSSSFLVIYKHTDIMGSYTDVTMMITGNDQDDIDIKPASQDLMDRESKEMVILVMTIVFVILLFIFSVIINTIIIIIHVNNHSLKTISNR